jgi:putative transposase
MCIKYRKQLLRNEQYCDALKSIFKEIAERYWFEIDEIGTDGDHVHVFVGAAGRWAPSQIMQVLKSISAKEMLKRFPEIRKKVLWGGEFWSDGGYIGTVGEGTTEDIVRKYIQNQGNPEEKRMSKQLRLFKLN